MVRFFEMRLLCIADIHGNYPALKAVAEYFTKPCDLILNGGDTTVYGPFPNETINWIRDNHVLSILGNTDRHIRLLLTGSTFKKPRKAEKRLMYGWTAAELNSANRRWLQDQPLSRSFKFGAADGVAGETVSLGMFHGSPDDPDEFLFADTPADRFRELVNKHHYRIITVGHSHSPFHKQIGRVHFVNPGSVGRMFDGNPSASCAVITVDKTIEVEHFRIPYPVETVVNELEKQRLPAIYQEMYRQGRKLN